MQNNEILGNDDIYERNETHRIFPTGLRIIINNNPFLQSETKDTEDDYEEDDRYRRMRMPKSKKSENFEVVANSGYTFDDVGGYDAI